MNVQCSLIRKLLLYKFEPAHKTIEATKNICWAKGEGAVDHSAVIKWFKKFRSCCKIRQVQEGLKMWIPKSYFEPLRQILIVASGEYQVSSVSYSPELFVTFTTSVKAFGATELCLTSPKYCKILTQVIGANTKSSSIRLIAKPTKMIML